MPWLQYQPSAAAQLLELTSDCSMTVRIATVIEIPMTVRIATVIGR